MKSHPTHRSGLRSAFTLIELLIVIVIIAILASVAFPVTAMVMEQARKAEAKNEVRNLVNAVNLYELEYGKLPFKKGGGGADLEYNTDEDNFIAMLAGFNIDGLNPSEKEFYSGKRAKGEQRPAGGLYGEGEGIQLVDPWGFGYFIVIDGDYDKQIIELPGTQDPIRKKAVAWSRGKPKTGTGTGAEFQPEKKWVKSWE